MFRSNFAFKSCFTLLFVLCFSVQSMEKKFIVTFQGNYKPIPISQKDLNKFPKLSTLLKKEGVDSIKLSTSPKSFTLVTYLASYKTKYNKPMPHPELAKLVQNGGYTLDDIREAATCALEVGADDIATSLNALAQTVNPQAVTAIKNIELGKKKHPLDTTVLVSFPDDPTAQPTSYPLFQLLHSITLKEMLQDFGITTDPIPVHNSTKQDFEFLLELIHPKKFGTETPSAEMLEKNMKELITKNPHIDFGKIVITADYLQFQKETIINGYVNLLKSTTYIPLQNSFDQISKELQRTIAGKLLHDLLKQENGTHISMRTSYTSNLPHNVGEIRPLLSSSSTSHGFALARAEQQSRYFDLLHKKEYLYNFFVNRPVACAMSSDAQYMLLIGYINSVDDPGATTWLIDLKTGNVTNIEKAFFDEKQHGVYHYQALYNNHDHNFYIIVAADYVDDIHNTSFSFYKFNPQATSKVSMQTFKIPGAIGGKGLQYSFINGNLVATHTWSDARKEIWIYTGNELLECTDSGNNHWEYVSNGEHKTIPFFVSQLYLPEAGYYNIGLHSAPSIYYSYVTIEKCFIPDFDKIITEKWKLNTIIPPQGVRNTLIKASFDATYLHFNYLKREYCLNQDTCVFAYTYSPFSLNLIAAIRIIDKADKGILASAYMLYHFTRQPNTWQQQCSPIMNSVLPEIKHLYFEAKLEATHTSSKNQLSLHEELQKPIVLPKPATAAQLQPIQQSWWSRLRQNAGQVWRQPREYMNSLYTQYKNNFLRSMIKNSGSRAVNN